MDFNQSHLPQDTQAKKPGNPKRPTKSTVASASGAPPAELCGSFQVEILRVPHMESKKDERTTQKFGPRGRPRKRPPSPLSRPTAKEATAVGGAQKSTTPKRHRADNGSPYQAFPAALDVTAPRANPADFPFHNPLLDGMNSDSFPSSDDIGPTSPDHTSQAQRYATTNNDTWTAPAALQTTAAPTNVRSFQWPQPPRMDGRRPRHASQGRLTPSGPSPPPAFNGPIPIRLISNPGIWGTLPVLAANVDTGGSRGSCAIRVVDHPTTEYNVLCKTKAYQMGLTPVPLVKDGSVNVHITELGRLNVVGWLRLRMTTEDGDTSILDVYVTDGAGTPGCPLFSELIRKSSPSNLGQWSMTSANPIMEDQPHTFAGTAASLGPSPPNLLSPGSAYQALELNSSGSFPPSTPVTAANLESHGIQTSTYSLAAGDESFTALGSYADPGQGKLGAAPIGFEGFQDEQLGFGEPFDAV